MNSMKILFPQMTSAMEEQNIHIVNNVGLSDPETELEMDNINRDKEELLATSAQLDMLVNLKKHVEKYGIDKGFLFLCNENDKLNKLFSTSIPTYESLGPNAVPTLAHTQELLVAMEDENEGLFRKIWNFIKALISNLIDLVKRFFSFFFGAEKQQRDLAEEARQLLKSKRHLHLNARPLENIIVGSSLDIIEQKLLDFSRRVMRAEAELIAALNDKSRNRSEADRQHLADLFRTSLDVARNGRDNALVRITNLDIKYATLTADKAEGWIRSVEQSLAVFEEFKRPATHLAQTLKMQIDSANAQIDALKHKPELMDRMIAQRDMLFCDMEALENLTRLVNNVNTVITEMVGQYVTVVNHFFLSDDELRGLAAAQTSR